MNVIAVNEPRFNLGAERLWMQCPSCRIGVSFLGLSLIWRCQMCGFAETDQQVWAEGRKP